MAFIVIKQEWSEWFLLFHELSPLTNRNAYDKCALFFSRKFITISFWILYLSFFFVLSLRNTKETNKEVSMTFFFLFTNLQKEVPSFLYKIKTVTIDLMYPVWLNLFLTEYDGSVDCIAWNRLEAIENWYKIKK